MFGALLLASLFPGAIAGGGAGGSACDGFDDGSTVLMLDSCFAGTAHFAPAGTSVLVENQGKFPHTFTAVDGSFDSGQVGAGSSVELAIEPGIYRVFCSLHGTAKGQGMAGVLIVGKAEAGGITTGGSNSAGPVQTASFPWATMTSIAGVVGLMTALAIWSGRRTVESTSADGETATT